jgi:hypothetical protein
MLLDGWMILCFQSKLVAHINGAISGHKLMSHEWDWSQVFFSTQKTTKLGSFNSFPYVKHELVVAHGEHVL